MFHLQGQSCQGAGPASVSESIPETIIIDYILMFPANNNNNYNNNYSMMFPCFSSSSTDKFTIINS